MTRKKAPHALHVLFITLLHCLMPRAGHFRNEAVGIYKGRDVVHVAPPAHRVSGLMADLFKWINEFDQHPSISYPQRNGRLDW